jgi:peptidoglycan-N-acetylglucosamine deacetylase
MRSRRTQLRLAWAATLAVAVLLAVGADQSLESKPEGWGDVGLVGSSEPSGESCPKPRGGIRRSGPADAKRVAITFDDGPSDHTRSLLRVLERNDATATFFVLGRELPGRKRILRAIARRGHEVGNHSTSHAQLPGTGDIAATNAMIEPIVGRPSCVFRPPQGVVSGKLARRVRALGMTMVTWSVDPGDWVLRDPEALRERVSSAIEPGAIVLLHDGGGDRSATVAALPKLLRLLRKRGYEFVTVSELLARKGDRASDGAAEG